MAEALIILGVALNVVFWLVILAVYLRGGVWVGRVVVKWAILFALLPALGWLGLYLERTESYGAFFLVMLVATVVLGLVLLARDRHSMETRQVVKWALLIVLLPALGLLGYLTWRFENEVQRGGPGRRGEAAPFLRKPTFRDR